MSGAVREAADGSDELPNTRLRSLVLALLVISYVVVSAIAYTDAGGPPSALVPLGELERRGLEVWRGYNCQVCHQLYGFGGFLGPDLTNRLGEGFDEGRARAILAIGSGAMPALRLSSEKQTAVLAFLRHVDTTGRSQPQSVGADSVARWAWIAARDPQQRGNVLVGRRCSECHTPFAYGPSGAPDLTRSELVASPVELRQLLSQGKGKMPAFPFRPEEVEKLSSFLLWVGANREALEQNSGFPDAVDFEWKDVPWFEYR